jgi:hypothetical protein
MKILTTEGVDNYLGVITEKMDEYGFIIYFFSYNEYYGYDKYHLELVSE